MFAASIACAAAFLYSGKFDLSLVFSADCRFVFGIAIAQACATFLLGVRYFIVLRKFSAERVKFKQIFASTLIATGLSSCLPFAMLWQDVFRARFAYIGLDSDEPRTVGHVTALTLTDRIIGVAGMFVSAAIIAVAHIASGRAVIPLVITATLICTALGCLFFLPIARLLLRSFKTCCFKKQISELAKNLLSEETVSYHAIPLYFLSILLFFLLSAGNWLGFKAVGAPVSFEITAIIYPLIIIASLLPANVFGIGAVQMVASMLFTKFGYDGETVASGLMLVAAVNVMTQFILAVAAFSFSKLRR